MEMEREFGWDDQIEKDGEDFKVFPEGDYDFEVTGFERARHNGSAKLPPCNKAVVSIRITDGDGNRTTIKHNLFLHSKCEGMLSAFFVGIGQKKKGEPLKMNWNNIIGTKGRCHVKIHRWDKDNGEVAENNQISYFHEPDPSSVQYQTSYQTPQQGYQQTQVAMPQNPQASQPMPQNNMPQGQPSYQQQSFMPPNGNGGWTPGQL